MTDAEHIRLQEAHENTKLWYHWGPYLSERQWGTVREDYSANGDAWDYFPHDHARSRAYRWGEDGLLGMCDDQGILCFALALWNEADPILKERLFGLTNAEGNHGEDVKEYYFFLDNTPTHSYMKALYKYPQRAFPYDDLVETNKNRGREEPEYELIDTGIFSENRYFDITMEYTKADPLDIVIRISVTNHGPEAAPLHLLPTLWYRNTWDWGYDTRKPKLTALPPGSALPGSEQDACIIHAQHYDLGDYWLACQGQPELLFTENESNAERLWGAENHTPFVKDGIHETIVRGAQGKVNLQEVGTKAAVHYIWHIGAGETQTVLLRLSANQQQAPFAHAGELFDMRIKEADAFYDVLRDSQSDDSKAVQRQAFAGLLWSKQFYMYDVEKWLRGDPAEPTPPPQRNRNTAWRHLNASDIIIMPDTWEYPWFAAWDLAFHCITMGLIDMDFAKKQILLLLHEWYMHPNGQLPAYEWAFSDVNPPVHAWSAWHLYKRDKTTTGKGDIDFLESVFHRLLLNFTWWVNRKDAEDNNIFEGGFLGLDNIGAFDRNMPLPDSMVLEQTDGTAWMGLYCLTMLRMAMELATVNRVYVDMATKFFEHFMYIADAINGTVTGDTGLWNEDDQFFYDRITIPDNGGKMPLKLRTLVGFIPLLAVETFQREILAALPELNERLQWFMKNRPYLMHLIATWQDVKADEETEFRMLALVRGPRLRSLLKWMLDPQEFLSDYGIRSLSKHYAAQPYELSTQYGDFIVKYDPAESSTAAFGGNSNWRGPVWFPINYMLVEALEKYHQFYGDELQVEDPTGSGRQLNLEQVAIELSRRLTSIFLRDEQGHRAVFGVNMTFQNDPYWRDCIPFYEYYHGDNGRGVGASHQTGWTVLVANLLERSWKTEEL
ncbi:MAG: MGH1-like glycoside hydrolase domain-containing protein [Ktedonobacteraceae bacterium]